jgi:ectoine hydroxylase-related dioxygenase (phytanoyl-CoA dioxygenase family)
MDMLIDPAWVAAYHDRGYGHIRDVFTADEVDQMRHIADGAKDGRAWRGPWLTPGQQVALRTEHGVHGRPPMDRLCVNERLIAHLTAVMHGRHPVIDQSTVVTKPPTIGQPFPLHQDAHFYGQKIQDYAIVTIVLDAFTDDNGPIRFLRGSHRRGLIKHTREHGSNKPGLPRDEYNLDDTDVVLANAGDCLVFSVYTVHGSAPNTSPRARRTIRVGYRPQ